MGYLEKLEITKAKLVDKISLSLDNEHLTSKEFIDFAQALGNMASSAEYIKLLANGFGFNSSTPKVENKEIDEILE